MARKFLWFALILMLGVSLQSQGAPSCIDVFRPSAAELFDGARATRADLHSFETFLKSAKLWREPEGFLDLVNNLREGDRIIVRGMAPREAVMSVENVSDGGRLRMRAVYGIQDEGVRPGFVIDKDISTYDLGWIVFDMNRYAAQGAAMERFAQKYNNGNPLTALEIKFNRMYKGWTLEDVPSAPGHFGYWIVYKVPKNTKLSFHPESKVRIRERVVGIPEGLEVLAVIPGGPP